MNLSLDQIPSVDTIHLGDRGQEGIHIINVVDEVTRFQDLGAVTEHFPAPSLRPSPPPSAPALPILRQCQERHRTCQEAVLSWAAESRDEPGKLLLAPHPPRGLKTPTEKNHAGAAVQGGVPDASRSVPAGQLALHVARHHAQPAGDRSSRNHGVRPVVVERLTFPPSGFHDVSARLGVGECPVKNPIFEEVVQDAFEPPGKLIPASARIQPADAIEDLPNCDRGEADPLSRDPVQELGHRGFRARPHHFRDNIRVGQPPDARVQVSTSSEKRSGR